jgi:hypothetical protein
LSASATRIPAGDRLDATRRHHGVDVTAHLRQVQAERRRVARRPPQEDAARRRMAGGREYRGLPACPVSRVDNVPKDGGAPSFSRRQAIGNLVAARFARTEIHPTFHQKGEAIMMTPVQILLVQTSFEMAGADGTALATRLERRLAASTSAPWLARVPAERVRQLTALLVLAVRGLGRRRLLRSAMRRLGARHADACLAVTQDAAFRRALLDALDDSLGAALPCQVREAWSACHRMLAALVEEGAGRTRLACA